MTTRLTATQIRDRAMTEAELLRAVLELAHIYHWRVAHFRPAMTSHGWRTPVQADGAGFPDLIMLRGARAIAAELKREKGNVITAEQTAWLDAFFAAGFEVGMWRPSDLDAIVEILK